MTVSRLIFVVVATSVLLCGFIGGWGNNGLETVLERKHEGELHRVAWKVAQTEPRFANSNPTKTATSSKVQTQSSFVPAQSSQLPMPGPVASERTRKGGLTPQSATGPASVSQSLPAMPSQFGPPT